MPTTIELPQVGESVTEGTVLRWLKKPGDRVARYDPLVEVETDKVTMEVPSPVAGVLTRLLVAEGARVPFGTPICEVEATGGVPSAPAAPATPRVGTIGVLEEPGAAVGPTGVREVEEAEAAPAAAGVQPSARPAPGAREAQRLSPVVAKLAAEHGLSPEEVARIPGTGLGGRVSKQDVLKHLSTRATPGEAGGEQAVRAPTTPPAPPSGPLEEVVPLTPVRRRIAENMVRSAREIPAAWSMVEVDVSGLVRRRQGAKEEFLRREGVELTYLPFVVHAVAQALKRHPRLNARWGGDAILVQKRTNIGVAVAAPQGLVVPVVHDADRHSIGGLAKTIAGLVERARQNRLALEDVQGGTFTVNNTGALGSVVSQPIINYPQAAILTTEAIVKRPVVTGDDAIAIRSMMNVCLTFDHRIADGAEVGAFLQEVKRLLEGVGEQTAIS